jgi:site-specific DNA recombinase
MPKESSMAPVYWSFRQRARHNMAQQAPCELSKPTGPAKRQRRLIWRSAQSARRKCVAGMKDASSKDAAAERAKDLAKEWPTFEGWKQHEFAGNVLSRVTLGETAVRIEIDKTKLVATLIGHKSEVLRPSLRDELNVLKLSADFQVLRRGGELRVISPNSESNFEGPRVPSLVKAVARAHEWYERIVAGEVSTIGELGRKSGLTRRYVRRILQCANLSPHITEALLKGKHRRNLTLKEIQRSVPLNWREQENRILRVP